MFLRKLFFVVGFFLLASTNCHATTIAEECAKRAKSAYDIGATDEQKQKLGSLALSVCFKEMEESLEKNGSTSSSSTQEGVFSAVVFGMVAEAVFLGIVLFFYIYVIEDRKSVV